jgi:hypothetical protein
MRSTSSLYPSKEIPIMDEKILTVYCLCEDLLKALGLREDPQRQMSDAEVMTTALVAALFFGGNFEHARSLLSEQGYIPGMLTKGRFNVRLHAISEETWRCLFHILSITFKELNPEQEYVVDSFPVPVCDNIRIRRCQLYQGEEFRGFIASKRRYFYGLRVHLVITHTGQPVEFMLAPGAWNDVRMLKHLSLDLPKGSQIYGDRIYTDYEQEDLLQEAAELELAPLRKKNSTRAVAPWVTFVRKYVRRRVETTASQITALFPKSIHAVTSKGFELKVMLFVLAFSIQCL